MVPAVRVAAAEAAVLLPEVFAGGTATQAPAEADADAYTLQLGLFLLPERAERASRDAAAKGIPTTTRLTVDARGRAWYQVTAGRFADRISAELASRSFLDAYPIADAASHRPEAGEAEAAPGGWSRG